MPRESSLPDPGMWQDFLRGLRLEDVILFEIRAKRLPEFPENPSLKPLEFMRKDFRIRYSPDNPYLLSQERLSVHVRAKGLRNPLVRITLHAGVLFIAETPYDESFEEIFRDNVHTTILWPYVRRWVQDLTRDMGLGDGILLPLIVVGGEEGHGG